jgi:hypothetical protein
VLVLNDNMANVWCLDSIMPAESASSVEPKRKRETADLDAAAGLGIVKRTESEQRLPAPMTLRPINAAPEVEVVVSADEPTPAAAAALGALAAYGSDDDSDS